MTPNMGAKPERREEERWRIGERRGEESSSRNSLNPLVSNFPLLFTTN
jgi:hypothetical protein